MHRRSFLTALLAGLVVKPAIAPLLDEWVHAGTLTAEIDLTAPTDDMPSRIVFSTSNDLGGLVERMRITADGRVIFPNGELSAEDQAAIVDQWAEQLHEYQRPVDRLPGTG